MGQRCLNSRFSIIVMINENWSRQIPEQNHQRLLLATLVSRQDDNNSILRKLFLICIDSEAGGRLYLHLSRWKLVEHPMIESI